MNITVVFWNQNVAYCTFKISSQCGCLWLLIHTNAHKLEGINSLSSAPFSVASELLLEGIIVVFNALTLAVRTHLENYCSAVQRNQYNSTNWALSREPGNSCNSYTLLQPNDDEEQKLNVTCKAVHLLPRKKKSSSANRTDLSASRLSFRENSSLCKKCTTLHGFTRYITMY